MAKKLKRPIAFMAAVAMMLTMLMYLPSSIISDIGWGLKASAATAITPSQPTGDGSVGSPYQIGTAAELYWFAAQVNSGSTTINAVLKADITVNSGLLSSLVTDESGAVTNGETFRSWTPIGNSNYDYNGTFNGNGKTISGLFYDNSTTDYVGLFGYIDSGTVTGVKVVDSYFRGRNYVGGVSGRNYSGEITNCGNSGKVVGTDYIGGVCGKNYSGKITNCGNSGKVVGTDYIGGVCGIVNGETINCYNTGYISGAGIRIGGVCGTAESASKITNCYNTGSVTDDGDMVGGVCGFLSGEMTDSYNTGSVSGSNTVGGVCGENHRTIKNCYNLGDVSGTLYVGGVCGWTDSGSKTVNCYSLGGVSGSSYVGGVCGVNCGALANCYFNSTNYKGEAIGNDSSGNSVNVSGKAAASFTSGEVAYLLAQGHTVDETVYDGSVWGQNIETETYPVLNGTKVYRNEVYSDCVGLTYVYANAEAEAVHVDHFFEKGICLFCGKIQPYAPQQDSEGVYQITNAAELYWFAGLVNGTLDGVTQDRTANAKLINDITVNENLLASLEYNADDNVTNGESFTSWTPIGNFNYDYNGTFNGNGKTISGLFCDKSTTDYVGLFGYIGSGKVTDVKVADSYIRGKNSVGGVCGGNDSSAKDLTGCYNEGTVIGSGDYIGGVCGHNYVGISGCYNTGSVSGNDGVGGVCGSTGGDNAKITNCYNTGTIIASGEYVGGVCGFLMGEMTGCYNTGSVIRSGTDVGGVCGHNYGTIKNCYNLGDVSGSIDVGGVCGFTDLDSKTVNCYSLGGVSGSSNVGGVCGFSGGALANCYFNSTKYTGEAIGYNYSGNSVNVSGKAAASFTGGEVAYLLNGSTSEGTLVWGQDLSTTTNYPVLGGAKVYQTLGCVGYSNQQNEQKAHTPVTANNAKAATCTKDGKEADTVCSVCGETLAVGATIPATGDHTPVSADNAVPATCTTAGKEADIVCSDCGETLTTGNTILATGHTDDDKNGICDVCEERIAYIVKTESSAEGGDVSSVANLNGGGNIKIGESTTVTASAVPGYTFLGWYNGETLLSSDLTFEYTPEADVTLTAKYKANEKMTITIDGGRSYTVSVNGGEASGYATSISPSYEVGTKLTVKANDDNFAYWQNEAKLVISRNPEYTFTVVGNMTVTAVYNTKVDSKAIVNFISGYDQIINRYQIKASEAFTVPEAPVKTGCDFAGWSINGGETVTENVADAIKAAITAALATETTADDVINVKAAYTVKVQSVTVTVTNGTGAGTYNVNDVVTVTANDPESGFKFSHWTDGTNILGYSTSYSFFAAKDITVEAVYVEDTVEVEAKGTTEIIDVIKNTTTGKISFVSMSTVPEDCSIVKAGIVATSDAGKASNLTDANADYVRGGASDKKACRYTWTKSNATGVTWYVRAYLVYTDKNGNSHTVYGDVVFETL